MNASTLRNALLPETLRRASTLSAFYRERIAHLVSRVRTTADLALLPTTSKADLATRPWEMVTDRSFPAHFGITSGSTYRPGDHAPPSVYVSSAQELEDAESIRRHVTPAHGRRALGVRIINSGHGRQPMSAAPGTFHLPFEKPFHYAHLRSVLTSDLSFEGFGPRVEILYGTLKTLKLLVAVVRYQEPALFDRLALSTVVTYGDWLSRRWRKQLSEAFRATTVNMYGLSEIPAANSMQCPHCGAFHVPPAVIPEVLDLDDQRPLSEGLGELVLTPLLPFAALQPLIRYRTGDLVRIADPCPGVDDIGVHLLGRRVDSPRSECGRVLVPSFLASEAFDDLVPVQRVAPVTLEPFGLMHARLGAPRATCAVIDGHPPHVHVSLVPTFDPWLFPAAAAAAALSEESAAGIRKVVQLRSLSVVDVRVSLQDPPIDSTGLTAAARTT